LDQNWKKKQKEDDAIPTLHDCLVTKFCFQRIAFVKNIEYLKIAASTENPRSAEQGPKGIFC